MSVFSSSAWGPRLEGGSCAAMVTRLLWWFQASCRSSVRRLEVFFAEPLFGGPVGGGVSAVRLLCSWLYMKVSWWALVTEPITSSSPLSEELGDAELVLVSMATVGSGSGLDSDWLEHGEGAAELEGAGPVSSEVGSVALAGRGLLIGSVWLLCSWLCNWLLFIMLFMALCISSSMRCFSRFGIRPKRTESLDMPTIRHFLKRHCWQRLRLILMMGQLSFLRHFLYWMFCWMLLLKKPLQPSQAWTP